jgi:hypothetical protein
LKLAGRAMGDLGGPGQREAFERFTAHQGEGGGDLVGSGERIGTHLPSCS